MDSFAEMEIPTVIKTLIRSFTLFEFSNKEMERFSWLRIRERYLGLRRSINGIRVVTNGIHDEVEGMLIHKKSGYEWNSQEKGFMHLSIGMG